MTATRRAVALWRDGLPHQALDVLEAAGFTRAERDTFIRVAVRQRAEAYKGRNRARNRRERSAQPDYLPSNAA